MSLFQKSVLNKHLNNLDEQKVSIAYEKFLSNYNSIKIEEIKTLKEEEYQDGFLRDTFVDVFGYTLRPEENYNLQREFKNQSDGKKADGAILKDGKALAVIELKSTKTKDLTKVTQQAFNYKNNQPDCKYVITSNFQKLRFYIDYAHEYEEFDLFNLQKDDFKLLYLILNKDNLLNNLPLKIKKETQFHEKEISNKLYKDYSRFKRKLYENLVKNQPEQDKLNLFKKSQKLLDRFLFILFAEDSGLLPPNSIPRVIQRFNILNDEDAYKPVYDIFKQYFNYMNIGRKGKKAADDIPAYNGGLFYPDTHLDNLTIDDDILIDDLLKLSKYDFNTEVDVNILGHIFEHSLNEIEEITAQIEGTVADKKKSKRKKDGVFYTPKYITQYIVDNTVGTLCNEKRIELGIDEIEFDGTYKKKNGGLKKEGEKLFKTLNDYKNWLLTLKILDPACGSGAFLNQTLNFLIAEHKNIDDILEELTGHNLPIFDTDKSILENNLFGVDINEESVEIGQLSLWLRTAKKGRKLSSLNDNIKCGNSLIDDPEVAGDKAFDWNIEFKDIMDKGGFDVVIGNPPYVSANDLKKNLTIDQYKFLKTKYKTAKGTVDLYVYFFEKGLSLLKKEGLLSYITPNRFLSASYGKALRFLIIENCQIVSLIDYSDKSVFPDASTYPVISFIKPEINPEYKILTGKFDEETKQLSKNYIPSSKLKILDDFILGFLLNDKLPLIEKLLDVSESLSNVGKINATSTAREAEEYSNIINDYYGYKLINTGTIDPYVTSWGFDELTDKGNKYLTPYLPNDSNVISKNRHSLYTSQKIVISKIGLTCEAFYDEAGEYASINTNCIHSFSEEYLPEYVLCWLNSKLYNYMFECFFDGLRMSGGYLLYSSPNLKNTYIKPTSIQHQKKFIIKSRNMNSLYIQIFKKKETLISRLLSDLNVETTSNKIKTFYKFDFKTFIAELKKKKVILSLIQQDEWEKYFTAYKIEINNLQHQINQTEKEINQMVYELYGLTEEEIAVVESSVK